MTEGEPTGDTTASLYEQAQAEMAAEWERRDAEAIEGDRGVEAEKNPEEVAAEHGIPNGVVEAAASQGVSLEYLIHAKDSHAAYERLKKLGINWGKADVLEPKGDKAQDPKIEVLKQGIERRERVEKAKKDLELALSEPLGSLALRGSFKRIGGPVPLVRKHITQRQLARKVYKRRLKNRAEDAKKKREEATAEGKEPRIELNDNGLLGRGTEDRKKILKEIRELDASIATVRSKLNPANSHALKRHESERHDIAEDMVRIQDKLKALEEEYELEPLDMYDRNEFGQRHKQYLAEVPTAQDRDKYEFLPKRDGPSEPEEIAGADHPSDATGV